MNQLSDLQNAMHSAQHAMDTRPPLGPHNTRLDEYGVPQPIDQNYHTPENDLHNARNQLRLSTAKLYPNNRKPFTRAGIKSMKKRKYMNKRKSMKKRKSGRR